MNTVHQSRVLLVEDYDDAREMYVEYLRFCGFEMSQAANGWEAIEKATARPPDVVVMDLSLPQMDGWEAVRRLKADQRTARIPVLALTGHVLADFSRRAQESGFDGFLTKPCLPEDLRTEILKILDARTPNGLTAGNSRHDPGRADHESGACDRPVDGVAPGAGGSRIARTHGVEEQPGELTRFRRANMRQQKGDVESTVLDRPVSREQLIDLLNGDLSREYQAIIAYVIYSQTLKGAEYMAIAKELEGHAAQELSHAITIAKQIDYLGGNPTADPKPVRLSARAEEMLQFDLNNETETIQNYRERVRQCEALSEYAMAEEIREILRTEQEHQIDLATALGQRIPTSPGQ
jgi:bacterioferritin